MIVTRSRLHAVRYKRAVDEYLAERGYPFKSLVAFSGAVQDGGQSYTESGMNGFPEAQTAKTFEQPEYRFLIVANKFQTGFDQPLLHTMYVDKKLGGVNAVQTLSRLNRTHPEKKGTLVLDFANESEEIKAAFEPYYETTLLSEATDPNLPVRDPDAPCRLPGVRRGRRGSLREGLLWVTIYLTDYANGPMINAWIRRPRSSKPSSTSRTSIAAESFS